MLCKLFKLLNIICVKVCDFMTLLLKLILLKPIISHKIISNNCFHAKHIILTIGNCLCESLRFYNDLIKVNNVFKVKIVNIVKTHNFTQIISNNCFYARHVILTIGHYLCEGLRFYNNLI